MNFWKIDPPHSAIHFKVKHMLIATVTGLFTKFKGTVESTNGANFEDSRAEISIETNSVYTNETYRDDHLRSPEFFDAEKFPNITFSSTSLIKTKNENHFLLSGNLTIKGITKEVKLTAIYGGSVEDNGQLKAGFEVTGTISRKAFDLTYNPLMEAGGMVVSENVDILANIELVKA
ncbi:YceI family protein [Olivibacter sp. SDN3]|uniref:YceI family protein n=1 Tax=Olivibacter sp. SDN3 TaxID=2764720 RepID=UPI001651220A|nr:YceI family protein [Olivibacter sp. SDN3]QNL50497.1 YceI family protein [Olivibacter sp. SDN3]